MFITRLLSGIVLAIGAFFSLYFGGVVLSAVLFFLSLMAYVELLNALGIKEERKNNIFSVSGYVFITVYYLLMTFLDNPVFMIMAAVLAVIGYLVVYVLCFPKYNAEDMMGAVFSFLYAPIMLSFVYLTRCLEDGNHFVWMILISSWGFDTFAYCVGVLTGKTIGNHKFLPKLSPKKSIEGVIGGIIGAGLLGFLYGHFMMPGIKWPLALIAAIGGVIAQIGDLAASAIKRDKNIKDYGRCIPGHGGVMDRFDSSIFTAPIIYLLAVLWLSTMK